VIKISVPQIGRLEKKAVLDVLQSGFIASGPKTKKFEEEFSRFVGTKFAIATSSGTAALHTALKCLGIKKGDEILTTPFSFIATSNTILFCQARPVFCDIEPLTFNIDPRQIRKTLNKKPSIKALVCVHLFGFPCHIEEIKTICKRYGILLIEDCAQAHGAEYNYKKVGSFGDCAIFSFYATKNMTTAEGGMITTNSQNLARRCRQFINHGRTSPNRFSILGYNYRPTDIASSLGLQQLKKIKSINSKRIKNANYLNKNLRLLQYIIPPFVYKGYKHVFHQYVIRVKKARYNLMRYLKRCGIESAIFYPMPIYRQGVYKKLGYGNLYLENTEKACKEVLSLPVHPGLKKKDLNKIVRTLKKWEKSK
jgi:dTDP-4-amino-4,6-dideoxygalactose transaminase